MQPARALPGTAPAPSPAPGGVRPSPCTEALCELSGFPCASAENPSSFPRPGPCDPGCPSPCTDQWSGSSPAGADRSFCLLFITQPLPLSWGRVGHIQVALPEQAWHLADVRQINAEGIKVSAKQRALLSPRRCLRRTAPPSPFAGRFHRDQEMARANLSAALLRGPPPDRPRRSVTQGTTPGAAGRGEPGGSRGSGRRVCRRRSAQRCMPKDEEVNKPEYRAPDAGAQAPRAATSKRVGGVRGADPRAECSRDGASAERTRTPSARGAGRGAAVSPRSWRPRRTPVSPKPNCGAPFRTPGSLESRAGCGPWRRQSRPRPQALGCSQGGPSRAGGPGVAGAPDSESGSLFP